MILREQVRDWPRELRLFPYSWLVEGLRGSYWGGEDLRGKGFERREVAEGKGRRKRLMSYYLKKENDKYYALWHEK